MPSTAPPLSTCSRPTHSFPIVQSLRATLHATRGKRCIRMMDSRQIAMLCYVRSLPCASRERMHARTRALKLAGSRYWRLTNCPLTSVAQCVCVGVSVCLCVCLRICVKKRQVSHRVGIAPVLSSLFSLQFVLGVFPREYIARYFRTLCTVFGLGKQVLIHLE